MADVVLPRVPEDVTAAWLLPKIGLDKATVANKSQVDGTATKLLLTVTPETTEEDGGDEATETAKKPLHVCVKGGFNPAMLAAYPFVLSLYTREVDFYNNVAPKVTHMNLPAKLWAGKNDQNAVIVMEDVSAADRGYVFADPVDTWSVDRVKLVVEQFAALHAATWGTQAADAPWLDKHYETSVLGLCASWDAIVLADDRPPIPDRLAYLKDKDRMIPVIKKWFATRNSPKFQCILHGDAHLGNTAWSAAEQRPMLVDWQIIHLGSCFTDIAYYVTSALTVEDRRAHETDIVDFYLAKLHEFGGPQMSRADDPEVMEEYRKSQMAAFSWVVCPYTMQTKERVWAIVSRVVPAMEDLDVVALLEKAD